MSARLYEFECKREDADGQCGAEVTVELRASGRYRRASIYGPAESPDIDVTFPHGTCCTYGHQLTEAEQAGYAADAEEKLTEEFEQ